MGIKEELDRLPDEEDCTLKELEKVRRLKIFPKIADVQP